MARMARYQERVETLYLDLRAYATGRFTFLAKAMGSSRNGFIPSIEDPEHEIMAEKVRNRVALYGTAIVLDRLDAFNTNYMLAHDQLGALRANAVLRNEFVQRGESVPAAFVTTIQEVEAIADARLQTLSNALDGLEAALRAELAA